MPHRNAPLTETGRLRLARVIVEERWSLRRAAERFQVSHTTAARWASRYRQLGPAGMVDRSSRPHHSPRRTPVRIERKVLHPRTQPLWAEQLVRAEYAPKFAVRNAGDRRRCRSKALPTEMRYRPPEAGAQVRILPGAPTCDAFPQVSGRDGELNNPW
jgi:transposase